MPFPRAPLMAGGAPRQLAPAVTPELAWPGAPDAYRQSLAHLAKNSAGRPRRTRGRGGGGESLKTLPGSAAKARYECGRLGAGAGEPAVLGQGGPELPA